MSQDPFLVVKSEVNEALATAEILYSSWARILRSAKDPETSEELANATSELTGCLSGIEADLDDLDDTIKAVELNPRRFPVTASELQSRREFVQKTRKIVQAMRDSTTETRGKVERELLFQSTSSASPHGPRESTVVDMPNQGESRQDGPEQERMQQMLIMEQQDGHLDRMIGTVTNLREVASVMGQELDDQNMILDDMERDVDRTQGRLGQATRRVKHILLDDSNNSCKMCTIILILLFVFLIVLLI